MRKIAGWVLVILPAFWVLCMAGLPLLTIVVGLGVYSTTSSRYLTSPWQIFASAKPQLLASGVAFFCGIFLLYTSRTGSAE